jgi:hypothetical protein
MLAAFRIVFRSHPAFGLATLCMLAIIRNTNSFLHLGAEILGLPFRHDAKKMLLQRQDLLQRQGPLFK